MIFLEYVGSRASLSARLIKKSPVDFMIIDLNCLEKVVISFGDKLCI